MQNNSSAFPKRSLTYGAIAGLIFGLVLRLLANMRPPRELSGVMTVGFVFFGPLTMGAITICLSGRRDLRFWQILIWPWAPVALGLLASSVMGLEGWICIAMFAPAGFLLASIGGLIGWKILERRQAKAILVSLVFLPLISPFVEKEIPANVITKSVHTEIAIAASPDAVWREIRSVRTIGREELKNSWVHRIGFPRPLDAEIDRDGLGGIRKARFERGLVFSETVDQWEPNQTLGFEIHVEPVPPQALDEHVTIGGPFFDVLHGRYRIESRGPKEVTLHLESLFRVSTHFNFYSALWTDFIMSQIQNDIMGVIRARAEKADMKM